jgi:hypothetical protein
VFALRRQERRQIEPTVDQKAVKMEVFRMHHPQGLSDFFSLIEMLKCLLKVRFFLINAGEIAVQDNL